MKRKIYLAISWRNEQQQDLVQLIRKHGHEVYDFKNPSPGNIGFAWSQIDDAFSKLKPEDFPWITPDEFGDSDNKRK